MPPVTLNAVGNAAILCVSAEDVLALLFAVPEYTAVMECDPVLKDDVDKMAWSLDTLAAPREVAPSKH